MRSLVNEVMQHERRYNKYLQVRYGTCLWGDVPGLSECNGARELLIFSGLFSDAGMLGVASVLDEYIVCGALMV
jgi:hypothetical protein